MREIQTEKITETVRELCIRANYFLPEDVFRALQKAEASEEKAVAKDILGDLIQNADIAKEKEIPICQDTGMAVFFVRVGQEVHITGGGLSDAINEGVRQGYREGYLRKSVLGDPLERINTNDNTPAVIHYDIVPGDRLEITFAPKGFGSENMSALKMLKPSDGIEGVKRFVLDTVRSAGANPCPPMVIGVGIGGTMEKCCQLAKVALTRNLEEKNPNPFYEALEEELLDEINRTGIGPQGFGGGATALSVKVETFATHIAGLPCAVNINCHATRHMKTII
ncbi:MAG: fumarate hydratase [Clostridia bacterium]|nr:fumarate hydratase [Clostridia bacterium]